VKLGTISLWGDELEAFRRQVHLAEELGCDLVTIGDAPFAWKELYVTMTVAALETQTATISPMVSVPALRNPVADVAAMCSLHELTGGRVAFATGTGGGVTGGLGRLAVPQAEMRDYLLAVRALFAGESITWDGGRVKPLRYARPVPVYYSAYGPKALRLAGEAADGVVLSVGSSMQRIDDSIAAVRAAARDAGRDPDEVDVWAYSFVSIRESRDRALDDISSFLASTAAYRLRPKHAWARVPEELREPILELRRRYDETEHVLVGGENARLVRELGLADFLAGESALAGTPDEFAGYVAELERRGVSALICALPGNADPEGTLRRFVAASRSAVAT
jgi:alkanesulfonate monooxygenase SsuD/methylene tetrahydromethanopterin reductase-like flavin-dependent oxidoreductase (luciferase family)